MDFIRQWLSQFSAYLQRFLTLVWYTLRSPRTTITLLIILALVLVLGLTIPPQPMTAVEAGAIWIANLPPWLQPGGETLFLLGFSRIFQSLWFWLPAALLLLNSLIALADYLPGTWSRLGKTTPPLVWQHPLAHRVEHSIRLPSLPDEFLETLKERLQKKGFSLYQPAAEEQRVTGTGRWRWAWLGLVAVYLGLIGLIGAFVITSATAQTERFTLKPGLPWSLSLVKGQFVLPLVEGATAGSIHVEYIQPGDRLAQRLPWRLYQPTLLHNTLLLPIAIEPVLTVEVRDATNTPFELEPLQPGLAPGKQLNFSPHSDMPFIIPVAALAVQISPAAPSSNVYKVQVRRESGEVLEESITTQTGQAFEIGGFPAMISRQHNLTVVARHDPAWPLYLAAAILILGGAGLTWGRPPLVVWLVPEVKGMGGQLYGVMEKLGRKQGMSQFLEELLTPEMPSEEQATD
ncbi:MAG: cytochrome c biogenesis protein ResB [Anaerolineae bacterium]|nr:cytochrome c biogenesis protein ResB [Anaerolineae bacterium]